MQCKSIVFRLRNLELGTRGQFRPPLPIVYGEIVAFHTEVTNLVVRNIASYQKPNIALSHSRDVRLDVLNFVLYIIVNLD